MFKYLKEYQGKALSVNALKTRLDNFILRPQEIKYGKKHLIKILNDLKASGVISSTFYNDEVHYFVVSSKSAIDTSSFKSKQEKKGKRDRQRESVGFLKPLIQDRKAFLNAQPFICNNCKKFTDTIRDFCEICGTQNSIRKATKNDFDEYIDKRQLIPVNELVPPLKPIPKDLIPKFKKTQHAPIIIDAKENEITEKSLRPIINVHKEINKNLEIVPSITEKKHYKPQTTTFIQPDPSTSFSELRNATEKIKTFNCKFCGMQINQSSKYCPQCGYITKKNKT